jgi:DNA-directed RNA polymerase specialized sigma24 family protein
MTGDEIALLYRNAYLGRMLKKHARRHSKDPDDQHDYIQDAWTRIYEEPGGYPISHYAELGRKEVHAAWKRQYRQSVDRKEGDFVHGYSRENVKHIYGNKFLSLDYDILDSWYYDRECDEYDVSQDSTKTWRWNRIEVHYSLPKKTEDKRR